MSDLKASSLVRSSKIFLVDPPNLFHVKVIHALQKVALESALLATVSNYEVYVS